MLFDLKPPNAALMIDAADKSNRALTDNRRAGVWPPPSQVGLRAASITQIEYGNGTWPC